MAEDPRWQWLKVIRIWLAFTTLPTASRPWTELAEALRRLQTVRGEPLEQSLRGGTQTDGNLFQHLDPMIVRLREAIRTVVAEHLAGLPPRDERHPFLSPDRSKPIRFSGAWSVRLSGGGYHANHVHPAGWISSALYVILPPDLGEGEAGFLTLGEPQAQLKLDLPPTRVVEPKSRPARTLSVMDVARHTSVRRR